MIKEFALIISIALLCLLAGCDSERERESGGGSGGKPIVLIGETLENCEGFLGAPSGVDQADLGVRSYIYQGFHIQIVYENGKSRTVVFRKVNTMGADSRSFSEADRDFVYRLCGIRSEDLKEVFNAGTGKMEAFTHKKNGQIYLLGTDINARAIMVMPPPPVSLKRIKRELGTR